MRQIAQADIGPALRALLAEPDPEHDDIGILGQNGTVLGVVIPLDAYQFFLKAVERAEDEADLATVAAWRADPLAKEGGESWPFAAPDPVAAKLATDDPAAADPAAADPAAADPAAADRL